MKTIRNERGNAMIITLLLLIILTALGIYAVSISTTEMAMSFQSKAGTIGFNAAESGIFRGYDQVGGSVAPTFTISGTLPNSAAYSGTGNMTSMSLAPGNGGNYRMASYEINTTGNASGFAVQRRLQAVVDFGPIPVGTMY
jgi:hypothetical protein